MKIIHLSDFNCPFSYIGLNRLKDVCDDLDLDVEWEMRSFEIDPNEKNLSAIESHAINNALSSEDAIKEIEEIEKTARNDGLNIKYKDMTINSSKDAHRLVKYVQRNHPQFCLDLVFKIFESNFIRNENIADHDVLAKIAVSCGLNEDEVYSFLEKESLKIEVALDMEEAITYGITTIPYYFVEYQNERLIMPGVFERESIKTAFEDLISGKIKDKTFI